MYCQICALKKDIKIIEVNGFKVPHCLNEIQVAVDDVICTNFEKIENEEEGMSRCPICGGSGKFRELGKIGESICKCVK